MGRRARERRRAQRRQQQRQSWLWIGGGAVIVLAVVGWLIFQGASSTAGLQAQRVPIQGAEHVQSGQPPPYAWNSDPPTSGWHDPVPARPNVYREPVPDPNLIHSLEHGYVIISYNCGDLAQAECDELISQLEDLFVRFGGFKLIVVPRPTLDTRIALSAWGWLDKFDEYDEERIVAFIDALRDKGPERTPE